MATYFCFQSSKYIFGGKRIFIPNHLKKCLFRIESSPIDFQISKNFYKYIFESVINLFPTNRRSNINWECKHNVYLIYEYT